MKPIESMTFDEQVDFINNSILEAIKSDVSIKDSFESSLNKVVRAAFKRGYESATKSLWKDSEEKSRKLM